MEQRTTIGPTIEIDGDLVSEDPVTVQGRIRGTIEANALVVESGAHVDATVQAESVEVSGALDGKVEASGRIEITAEGRVTADLAGPRIVIADGAQFRGHIEMDKWRDKERS